MLYEVITLWRRHVLSTEPQGDANVGAGTLEARLVEHGAQLFEANAGCIGSQNGPFLHRCLHLAIEILLGLQVLENSLDDEVCRGDTVAFDSYNFV